MFPGLLSQISVVARLDGRMNSTYAVREAMDTPADIFNGYRPRLFGIAYRMLGSRAAGRFLRSGPWSSRLLSYTFHMLISEQHRGERPSRVTFELQPMGSVVKLTLTHDDFESQKATLET